METINIQELVSMYNEENKSLQEIGDIIGRSRSTVQKMFSKNGYKLNKSIGKYENNVSIETIKTDLLQVQWKIKDYMDKQTIKGEEKQYLGTKLSEMTSDSLLQDLFSSNILVEQEYEKYYVLTDENLATAGLEITNYKDSYF